MFRENTSYVKNLPSENPAVYEIMWKNVQPDRPQMAI
jgi:hypothetical protein